MGETIQRAVRLVGTVGVGVIIGALLHSSYTVRQEYKAKRVQDAERVQAIEQAYPQRLARQARHGASRAIAADRMAAATASAPAWAETPVPEAVIKELADETYSPTVPASSAASGLQ